MSRVKRAGRAGLREKGTPEQTLGTSEGASQADTWEKSSRQGDQQGASVKRASGRR